jgi:hypothetical protein
MDPLTKTAIDRAFIESLTRLLVVHNTRALTGDVSVNAGDYASLIKQCKTLLDERAVVISILTSP